MGVKKLADVFKQMSPNCVEEIDVNKLQNQTVSIDTNFLIHQSVTAIRGAIKKDIVNSDGKIITHIKAFIQKVNFFQKNNINPIFVFDGAAPELKQKTITKRKDIKQDALNKCDKTSIQQSSIVTKEQFEDVKHICKLYGIPYVQSQGEADVDCAQLYIDGVVDYVISNDCDIIVFGAGKLIRNFSAKKNAKYEMINMETFSNETGWDQTKLAHLAILLGTDYNDGIHGIGPKKGVKMLNNMDIYDILEKYCNHEEQSMLMSIVDYYTFNNNKYNIVKNQANLDELATFTRTVLR